MKRIGLLLLVGVPLAYADAPAPEITLTPTTEYVTVKGNENQFKADNWMNDGWNGGGSATLHEQFSDDTTLDLAGHGLGGNGDYGASLDWLKQNLAFFHAGWSEYRQYSDYTGGFYQPFTPSSFTLPGDNYLTIGKISVSAGLLLPNLPKITLGYERQYRSGEESLLEWSSVTQGTTSRKIYPSSEDVNEHTDIIKVGIEHDIKNVHLADQFQYEHYATDTTRTDVNNLQMTTINETYSHDAFFNTFRMDSHYNDQVYWSIGYLYTTLSGNAAQTVNTAPPATAFSQNWVTQVVDIGQDSQVVNANAMFGPFKSLTLYVGLQAEKTSVNGFTDALQTTGLAPAATNLVHSSDDTTSLGETAGARYTKIPFTTLYAEARWTEQQIDLDEYQTSDNTGDFVSKIDDDVFEQDYRAGFNTSPWRYVNFAGRYRYALYENDYDNNLDSLAGYPGYITLQNFTTDEVMAKVTVRPCSYFTGAFQYQLVTTDIKTGVAGDPSITPSGTRISGTYDANIYTVSATVTPISRLYLMGLVSFLDTTTTAFDNQSPAVTTYRGNVYTVIGTAGYAVDEKTDLTLEYTYSASDNFKNNAADGLPLGLDYQRTSVIVGVSRKFAAYLIARLRYGWMQYNETSTGGINDYTAQLVSASCTLKF